MPAGAKSKRDTTEEAVAAVAGDGDAQPPAKKAKVDGPAPAAEPAAEPAAAAAATADAAAAATDAAPSGTVETATGAPLVPYDAQGLASANARSARPAMPPGFLHATAGPAAAALAGRQLPVGYVFASAHYNTAGAPAAAGHWDGRAPAAATTAAAAGDDAGDGKGGKPVAAAAAGAAAGGAKGKDKRKWARVQADKPTGRQQRAEGSNEYNIWYGKYLGDKPDRERERASSRCVLWRDAGLTMADVKGDQPYVCVHFARGACVHGPNCMFLHRLPDERDYGRIDMMHDVFGRERHGSDRDDMDGVGSFNREGRTLWVTNFNANRTGVQEVVQKHFAEWGAIEECAIKPKHKCAFIRFVHRLNAEFAKVAMAEQSLDNNEQLTVRWAHEDPNPVAQRRIQRDYESKVASALVAKGATTEQDAGYHVPHGYVPPPASALPALPPGLAAPPGVNARALEAYPDTDVQYGADGAPAPAAAAAAAAAASGAASASASSASSAAGPALDPNDPASAYHRQLAAEAADAAAANSGNSKLYDAYATATAAVAQGGAGLDSADYSQHQLQYMQHVQQHMQQHVQQHMQHTQQQQPMYADASAMYAAYYAAQGMYPNADGSWSQPAAAGSGPVSREQAEAMKAYQEYAAKQKAVEDSANSFSALLDKIDGGNAAAGAAK